MGTSSRAARPLVGQRQAAQSRCGHVSFKQTYRPAVARPPPPRAPRPPEDLSSETGIYLALRVIEHRTQEVKPNTDTRLADFPRAHLEIDYAPDYLPPSAPPLAYPDWGSGVPSTRSQFWALGRAFEHACRPVSGRASRLKNASLAEASLGLSRLQKERAHGWRGGPCQSRDERRFVYVLPHRCSGWECKAEG